MNNRKNKLSASIITALMFTGAAFAHGPVVPEAQQSTAQEATESGDEHTGSPESSDRPSQEAVELGTVFAVGIRASMQKSLQTKRTANAVVEAITAEDIGKFPNTNAAETLSLTPGIQVDRQFGQGQRITIDGINSTLNLSLLDGHPVAQTSWRYFSAPQRGFNYLMIAPQILGRLEVFKSQQARLPSGSIGGTVIMHTRKPLDMDANTVAASVRYNYNDQAGGGEPSESVLYSWKNDSSTFGFNVALQHYEERVDRQGLEIFGYTPVSAFAEAGNTYVQEALESGELRGDDLVPQEVNSAWFQQTLKRDSALVNLQFQPNDSFYGNLSLLHIKEEFTNYNQSIYNFLTQAGAMLFTDHLERNADGIIIGGHVTPDPESSMGIIYDNQLRPSEITTNGADLKLGYIGDGWAMDGRIGYSKAENADSGQIFIEPTWSGPHSWNINTGFAPDDPEAFLDPAQWSKYQGWMGNFNIFGSSQEDKYGELNFQKYFDGVIHTLELGARYMDARTDYNGRAYGGVASGTLADIGIVGISDILGNFPNAGFGSAHHPVVGRRNVRDWVLNSPDLNYPSAGPRGGNPAFYSQYTWAYDQEITAAFAQANFSTDVLRGNFGVRWVRTKNTGYGYNVPTGTELSWDNLDSFYVSKSDTSNEFLPSFTVIYDNGGDLVLRGSMAKVMAWAPYNTMAYQVALNDTTFRGTMGNPGLTPYIAYNTNLSAEWYFAPQAVIAVSAFYKNITNYIWQQEITSRQYNNIHTTDPETFAANYVGSHGCEADGYCDYLVKQFVGGGTANAKGVTLAYQQAFENGFGIAANYTYATGSTNKGTSLPFLSRHTVSVSPYFESGPFSARLNVNSRSKYQGIGYVAGAVTPTTDAFTTVSASLGWAFNDNWTVSVTGDNLTDTRYYQYRLGTAGQELPLSKYTTGRRFSVAVQAKF